SFRLWETEPLRPNLLRAVSSDAALIVVELVLVLPVVALDDPDLLVTQTRDPANDLIFGAPVLEVRNQVVNRNPAGGELNPSATINQSDLFLHRVSSARAFGTRFHSIGFLASGEGPPMVREGNRRA